MGVRLLLARLLSGDRVIEGLRITTVEVQDII